MKKYLFILIALIFISAEGTTQHFRIKKGTIEYVDTTLYPINDSTLSNYFFSPTLDLRYPVSKDSLQKVYSKNTIDLYENGNKIRVLNGGGGSHGNDQWQLYFYHYYENGDSIIKKSFLSLRMYEQRYEIYYNPLLIAENAGWVCKPKKFHLAFYNQAQHDSPFLQGHIDLRFKVKAYSDKQLLLFTNTIDVKGYFIFIRDNKLLKN